MLTIEMIVSMLVWPAVATAAALGLAWLPPVAKSRAAPLVGPLAVAVGFGVGYWVVVGRPELLPPVDAKARLPHIAVIGLAIAATAAWVERRAVVYAAAAVGSLAAMWLVLAAAIEFQWSTGEAVVRVTALAAGMFVTAVGARQLSRRLPKRSASLGLAALGGLVAPLMLFSDSLLMAQLHGALGITIGVAAVAVFLAPARLSVAALAPVVVAVAWSQWVIALLFANMPVVSFVLLVAAAPAAVGASVLVQRWRPRRHALAALVTLGVLVASSVALGGLRYARTTIDSNEAAASPDNDDYGYGYGYDQ